MHETRVSPGSSFDDAIEAYKTRGTVRKIAHEFGVSSRRLLAELRSRNLLRDKNTNRITKFSVTAEQTEKAFCRYEAGERVCVLADDLGVDPATLYKAFSRLGFKVDPLRSSKRRMANLGAKGRLALISAAHSAMQGTTRSEQELTLRAQTRQARCVQVSPQECVFADWLIARGITPTPQQAIGRYNTDLAIGTVAVEIQGGHWHSTGDHARRAERRARYFFDRGWDLVFIWAKRSGEPFRVDAADYVVTFLDELSRNPTAARQYRMIWGDGQVISRGCSDDTELTVIPPSTPRAHRGG